MSLIHIYHLSFSPDDANAQTLIIASTVVALQSFLSHLTLRIGLFFNVAFTPYNISLYPDFLPLTTTYARLTTKCF